MRDCTSNQTTFILNKMIIKENKQLSQSAEHRLISYFNTTEQHLSNLFCSSAKCHTHFGLGIILIYHSLIVAEISQHRGRSVPPRDEQQQPPTCSRLRLLRNWGLFLSAPLTHESSRGIKGNKGETRRCCINKSFLLCWAENSGQTEGENLSTERK